MDSESGPEVLCFCLHPVHLGEVLSAAVQTFLFISFVFVSNL